MDIRTAPRRRATLLAAAASSLLLLAGCAGTGAPGSTDGAAPTEQAPTNVAPGYSLGEIPPIPDIEVPDMSLMLSFESGFASNLSAKIGSYPGVSVKPAQCDASGAYTGTTVTDTTVTSTTDAGQVVNFGDGSGTITHNGWTYYNFGDGSASLDGPNGEHYSNFGDGTGSYKANGDEISIYSAGGGQVTRANGEEIYNSGVGNGHWEHDGVRIENDGNGGGTYTSATLTIENNGDGTATVNGETVEAEPLAPLEKVEALPPMASIAPSAPCGLTVTLENEALFDFDSASVRPESEATLASLAQAMTDLSVPNAEVSGHADSVGDDASNQTLSEQRAQAVVAVLQGAGVTSALTAVGYGETRPVAPNENADGSDNPAGRQENRRVEVFIPNFDA